MIFLQKYRVCIIVYDRIFHDFPAKIPCMHHRIWPYISWFPCQKYRVCTVYPNKYMVLARPTHMCLPTSQVHMSHMCRVGQNCIYTPYMTVHFMIFLPKIPCMHRIWPYISWFSCKNTVYASSYMTVYFMIFLQKYRVCTVYDRTFHDFPAKNTVYASSYMIVYFMIFLQKYRVYVKLARTIYIRCFWQGNHQIYGHTRCIYRFWPTIRISGAGNPGSRTLA